MKHFHHTHMQPRRYALSYPLPLSVAQALQRMPDESVLPLNGGQKLRGWKGEKWPRYALEKKPSGDYSLIMVGGWYKGKTFVFLGDEPRKKSMISDGIQHIQKKTQSRFGRLLPAIGVAALLSLDAYCLQRMTEKTYATPEISQSQPDTPINPPEAKIPQIPEILAEHGIAIEDFILNNPALFPAVDAPLENMIHVPIPADTTVNTAPAPVSALWNPFESLLWQGKSLEEMSQDIQIQRSMDEFHTMLETMISVECVEKNGLIPKDVIGWSDTHKWEQYAGINMNSAKNTGNPEKLQHAQEIAACHARGDQKTLRTIIKTYYLLYYFPQVQSQNPAVTAFLLDTSMNRGANAIQPLCKMVMNQMVWGNFSVSRGSHEATDKKGMAFTAQQWDTSWTAQHQKIWDILCLRRPHHVIRALTDARRMYEEGTYWPRPSLRKGLEARWKKVLEVSEEMLLPAVRRTISYHDSVALIEKSLTSDVRTHDSGGKLIIYRVQRIANPTKNQVAGERAYRSVVSKLRPKKEMVLFHGTASGILGKSDERIRDLGWFNAIYKSSNAAYIMTGKGLVFEFFDPMKWYGAANATRIAESTWIPKEDFNFNEAGVGVELCLRGYEGGPFAHSEEAKYGVERPTDRQKRSCRELVRYLQQKLGINYIGTSADPVRDHAKCRNEKGEVLFGPKYLVPEAHCDDFCPADRVDMGIMSAEEMADLFSNKSKLSSVFHFPLPENKYLANR